MKHNISIVTVV